MGQSPKRGRVDYAVAVPLKRGPRWMLGLRMKPPARLLRFRRIGRQTVRPDHMASLRRVWACVHLVAITSSAFRLCSNLVNIRQLKGGAASWNTSASRLIRTIFEM